MCIFFFKQKTAYEMRISDWSSDVCSSDLILERAEQRIGAVAIDLDLGEDREGNVVGQRAETGDFRGIARFLPAELVARKAQHLETARAEAAMEDRKSTRLNSSH